MSKRVTEVSESMSAASDNPKVLSILLMSLATDFSQYLLVAYSLNNPRGNIPYRSDATRSARHFDQM